MLTNTGVSAARLYWENKADFFNAKNISIPYAISVFPDELYHLTSAKLVRTSGGPADGRERVPEVAGDGVGGGDGARISPGA